MPKNRKIKDTYKETPTEKPASNRLTRKASSGRTSGGPSREIGGILALGGGVFIALAMLALQTGNQFMGPFGRFVAELTYGLAGLGSYALVALMIVAAVRSLMERRPTMPLTVGLGVGLGVLSVGVLLHLAAGGYRAAGIGPGGALGEHGAEIFRALISTAGTALLAAIGLVIAVVIATPLRMRQLLGWIGLGGRAVGRKGVAGAAAVGRFSGEVVRAILPERERDDYDGAEDEEPDDALAVDPAEHDGKEPPIIVRGERERGVAVPGSELLGDTERVATEEELAAAAEAEPEPAPTKKKRGERKADTTKLGGAVPPPAIVVEEAPPAATGKGRGKKAPASDDPAIEAVAAALAAGSVVAPLPTAPGPAAAVAAASAKAGAPMIVESRFTTGDKTQTMAAKEQQALAERQSFIKLGDGDYQLPSISLLKFDSTAQNTLDTEAMLELSARLTQTLENYGIKGEVVAIRPGPVVTMYEFAPAPGTRVNKIANLADDLAMALAALKVRIVAPIPGKAAVGIEVPNANREKVFVKEILADEKFLRGKARLPMALGKDIEGAPEVVDLASMPHLLVAGTTGSGKSVAVNTMITSLLYHCSPEDVRMIMVDPKMLELSIYEGIPHLLLPVVTDPKKANLALRWAVDEMERRYELLANAGVRDIATYNAKAAKDAAKHEADKLRAAADAAARALETEVAEALEVEAADGEEAADGDAPVELTARKQVAAPPTKLPFIVVVIDEFADLMMCAPKDVETSVARIAQKARAAGIHLILATQRPSVDVITGLIKANFPSRIAFRVTSKIDSRTILDEGGAEALLGSGDMLFRDRGAAPRRLHGCYIDEEEIHKVVAFLKTQARPVYNLDILKPRDDEESADGGGAGAPGTGGGNTGDDMYDKAVYVVTTTRNASISWVQRQLRIGYNRAARLVEEMEKQGVVSGPDHTNKREVLVAGA
ncbi:MAG: DNA translocase FtsK 4TM domain-containing protein [Kofleriaceae bacterium]